MKLIKLEYIIFNNILINKYTKTETSYLISSKIALCLLAWSINAHTSI